MQKWKAKEQEHFVKDRLQGYQSVKGKSRN